MSDLVVAEFDTQFAAAAALDRLISRGLRRRAAHVRSSESVGGSAASSSAPTTVVSRVSHHADTDHHLRAPAEAREPALVGHATLTIELSGLTTLEDVMQLLEQAGAFGVHVLVNQPFEADNPALSPAVDYGRQADVTQAIEASQPTERQSEPKKAR